MAALIFLCIITLAFAKFDHLYADDPTQATLHILNNNTAISSEWSTDVPFYPKYPTRTVQVLDGNWNFGYGGSDVNLSKRIAPNDFEKLTPNITYVPSAFDVKPPGILGVRGTAFYRANVTSTKGFDIQVYIAACAFYCQLYFDGNYIGDHRAGGYQPFWFHIDQSMMDTSTSNHQIFIVSDNQYNKETAPTYTGGDFYHFGGLNRNLLVHTLPIPSKENNYLLRVEAFPKDMDKMSIDLNITFGRAFNKDETKSFKIVFDGDNDSAKIYSSNVKNGKSSAQITDIVVPNGKLWSLTSPHLHTVTVNYVADSSDSSNGSDDILDAIQVRFGLRWVGIDSKQPRITLNGDIIKLHGWNRHTMYPDTGNALTMSQLMQDMALVKEANANYLRGAHYPQDQRWLDLCDQNGIAMWSETLGPDVKTSNLEDPYFMKYQIQAVNEMLDASINNPSVFFWGFYNEGPSDEKESIPGYNASANAIRARDRTRLITWADNKESKSLTIGPIADVASFNEFCVYVVCDVNVYDEEGDINHCYDHWNEEAATVQKMWPGKPLLISETGAGAVYEWDNDTNVQWSQMFQSEVVYADVTVALNNSLISGISLWQFADIKANNGYYETKEGCNFDWYPEETIVSYVNISCHRPKCENNKGSVDYWRRYKNAFDVVQKLFHDFKE